MAEKSTRTAYEQKKLDEGLWSAAREGDDDAVRELLAKGASVNYVEFITSWTPSMAASERGHLSTLELLVNSGADLKKTDGYGYNCAHHASRNGHLKVLRYLIDELGLDPLETNNSGDTCLHLACIYGRLDLITFLMDAGLSLESPRNKAGKTPLDYLKEESVRRSINQRRQECLKALKIGVKSSNETEVVDQDTAATANTSEGLQSNVKSPVPNIHEVERSIKQASGKIKVARVLLHGGPQVGKTSVKRLIFNYPPLEKENEKSTPLVEDPVRAISTRRMMSTDHKNLEEVDETKLIQMIQKEVKSHLFKREEEKLRPSPSDSTSRGSKSLDVGITPAKQKHQTPSNKASDVPSKITPEVLTDIAKDLDSIDPDTPELFACKFAHLVDSGGQPQYSDLLPLVFQSESHNHMAVIPLSEKLDAKPCNCVNTGGKKVKFPDSLLLTHFQLIERVCQLAKASESRVMIVGTHLDQENAEEPLAEKERVLKSLLEKYQDNLIKNEDGNIIFAVNAMVPEGKVREEYAAALQKSILDFCCCDEEKTVPLRWMALELELSRRSKESGEIVDKAECDEIAKSLEIQDLDDALSFFTELAVHYYYAEAVPGIIFTSVGSISSRLSAVVEASFLCNAKDRDSRRLQEKGELSTKYLIQLLSKQPKNDLLTNNDFLKLIRYLRILFNIDDDTLFIPSLLPVKTSILEKRDCFHPVPLACYWYDDDYQEVRILPQSFFHALIVELLQKRNQIRFVKTEQTRSSIVLRLKLESGNVCTINLVNRVFWLELFAAKTTFSPSDIPFLTQTVQCCSRLVLKRLKLSSNLGDLRFGLLCPKKCGKMLPHLCESSGTGLVFRCLEDELCEWEEEDGARLFWISCLKNNPNETHQVERRQDNTQSSTTGHCDVNQEAEEQDFSTDFGETSFPKDTLTDEGISLDTSHPSSLFQKRPKLSDAFRITRSHSVEWYNIARELDVSLNYRKQLMRDASIKDNDKLEEVLDKWIETESVPVTWSSLIEALETIELRGLAREVKEFLKTPKAVQTYSQSQ